jgi:hypothetical protein
VFRFGSSFNRVTGGPGLRETVVQSDANEWSKDARNRGPGYENSYLGALQGHGVHNWAQLCILAETCHLLSLNFATHSR